MSSALDDENTNGVGSLTQKFTFCVLFSQSADGAGPSNQDQGVAPGVLDATTDQLRQMFESEEQTSEKINSSYANIANAALR